MSGGQAREERGVALLVVLLLLASVAVVAVATTELMARSVARTAAAQARDRAVHALAGAEIAAQRIIEARTSDAAEDLGLAGPDWLREPVTFPIGEVVFEARFDAVACINVNAVVEETDGALVTPGSNDGEGRGPGIARFGDLIEALGGNRPQGLALAETVADFIDTDDVPNTSGGEDFDYLTRAVPYRTAGTLLADVSELRAIAGWDRDTYGALAPYLCALPTTEPMTVDINSLEPEDAPVLRAILGNTVPMSEVERLVASPPGGGYESVQAFAQLPVIAAAGSPPGVQEELDVKPSLISFTARLAGEGQELSMTSLFYDDAGEWRVIRREFGGA